MKPSSSRFATLTLGIVLLVGIGMVGCDKMGTEPEYLPPMLVASDGCPEPPCDPPTEDQKEAIQDAIDNLKGISSFCDSIASSAESSLNAGDIMLGDYYGATHWTGSHPNDTYDITEIDADFEMWPPLLLEYILAHELVHKHRHMHQDQENEVTQLAEQCADI